MKRAFFVVLTLAMTFGLVALTTEVALRVLVDDGMQYDLEMWKYAALGKRLSDDPEIGHEHVPGASFRAMGVDIAINSYGMRGAEISREKPSNVTRILMLGDSLTFGWGVEYEKTVPRRLETLFRKNGATVEVLNTGVGNTNTSMQVAYFLSRGRDFNPDVVVLNYFINDAEPMPRYDEVNFLERYSYSWNYLSARLDVFLRMLNSRQDWRDYYRDLYAQEGRGDWEQAREAIGRLAEFCRKEGIPLLLVNYPELRELNPYPFMEVNALIEETARNNDIRYLDQLPAVQAEDERKLWVTEPDPHPNAFADELFARAIYRKLRSMLDFP